MLNSQPTKIIKDKVKKINLTKKDKKNIDLKKNNTKEKENEIKL
jgi:hypothetical protein